MKEGHGADKQQVMEDNLQHVPTIHGSDEFKYLLMGHKEL